MRPTGRVSIGVVTADAPLAASAVHGEAAARVLRGGTANPPSIDPEHLGGGVDDQQRVVLGQVADVGPRAELGGPQHLAPVDVADTLHDVLVDEHVTQTRLTIRIRQQQVDRFAAVD